MVHGLAAAEDAEVLTGDAAVLAQLGFGRRRRGRDAPRR
jgi:hypothetical protein